MQLVAGKHRGAIENKGTPASRAENGCLTGRAARSRLSDVYPIAVENVIEVLGDVSVGSGAPSAFPFIRSL